LLLSWWCHQLLQSPEYLNYWMLVSSRCRLCDMENRFSVSAAKTFVYISHNFGVLLLNLISYFNNSVLLFVPPANFFSSSSV
jgi:hypothetical protein